MLIAVVVTVQVLLILALGGFLAPTLLSKPDTPMVLLGFGAYLSIIFYTVFVLPRTVTWAKKFK